VNDHSSTLNYPLSSRPASRTPDGDAAGRPLTVVIVDDETHIRLVVGEQFRSKGFTVLEAHDGEEALELITTQLPDAIVTDLQMPYMNGLELCSRLAADPRTAGIPALLLTARGHIVESGQLQSTVIRKTMAKPFSAKALFENVQSLISSTADRRNPVAAPAPAFKHGPTKISPLTGEAA
jgi:CheY-like chemotaxis protein